MATCIICNTTENLVYSGVDAFLLGITETTCYDCANRTKPSTTLEQALKVISDTADFYHSMHVASGDEKSYWSGAYMTALDLTERIQGLPENSLLKAHDNGCDCIA